MAVLAHPDDESLGVGGTLAKYASEGVDVFLLTATRGERAVTAAFQSAIPNTPVRRRWGKSGRRVARGRVGVGNSRSLHARLPRRES